MAFNLPPPWDPGYALPGNVRDEGLQRRGFVTKEMPRGTYDQPKVGTGGYAVPGYVMDEGYGQGTFTTKWEPRGEYDGGAIPYWLNDRPRVVAERRLPGGGRQITMAPAMSGTDDGPPLPPQFQEYGAKAADHIIAVAARAPAAARKAVLRSTMDQLDKTLWKRTQDISRELVGKGMTPGQAFRPALTRALAAGIAAQLIRVGQTSAPPKTGPLLGLGGISTTSSGDAKIVVIPGGVVASQDVTVIPGGFVVPPNTAPVTCTGYSWNGSAWTRTKAGTADVPGPASVTSCPTVTVHPSTVYTGPMYQAGPFTIPFYEGAKVLITPKTTTPEQLATLFKTIALNSARQLTLAASGGLQAVLNATDQTRALQRMWPPPTSGKISAAIASGSVPLFRVKDKDTGKYWGLVVGDIGTEANPQFTLKLVSWKQSWIQDLFDALGDLIGGVIDVLSDLACSLVNNPKTASAAASTGTPTGTAIAAGASIAQQTLCKPPAPTIGPGGASDSILLPVAIAGGAVLVALMLTKKKKAPSP